jgi:hypothetical protein
VTLRSTERTVSRAALAAASVLLLAGCGLGSDKNDSSRLPRIAGQGSRAHEYTSLTELAQAASAVVVAVPADAAPTPYVQLRVTQVLSDRLSAGLIDLVSPGVDENTGQLALAHGGRYLIYLAPAM